MSGGVVVWEIDSGDSGGALALDADAVYVLSRSYVSAFAAEDGAELWYAEIPGGTRGGECLAIEDDRLVVVDEGAPTHAFRLRSGAPASVPSDAGESCDNQRVDPGYSFNETALLYEDRPIWQLPADGGEFTSVRRVGRHTLINDFDAGLVLVTDGEEPVTLAEAGDARFDESPIAISGSAFAVVTRSGALVYGVVRDA